MAHLDRDVKRIQNKYKYVWRVRQQVVTRRFGLSQEIRIDRALSRFRLQRKKQFYFWHFETSKSSQVNETLLRNVLLLKFVFERNRQRERERKKERERELNNWSEQKIFFVCCCCTYKLEKNSVQQHFKRYTKHDDDDDSSWILKPKWVLTLTNAAIAIIVIWQVEFLKWQPLSWMDEWWILIKAY